MGDLFQLAKYNPDMVRTYLRAMAAPVHNTYESLQGCGAKQYRGEYFLHLLPSCVGNKFKGVDWKKMRSAREGQRKTIPKSWLL